MSRERIWLLVSRKLAGESEPEEILELEELLRGDPDLYYALQHITDIWQLPARLPKDAEDAFMRHKERLKAAGADWQEEHREEGGENTEEVVYKRPMRTRWLIAACVLAGVVTVAGILFYTNRNTEQPVPAIQKNYAVAAVADASENEVTTHNGSRTKVTLPDGTQVWLNSGSRLVYNKDFGHGHREARLIGEAYFDVTRNPEQPFTIHTRDMDIRVLGTAFNVRSYPDEQRTETSLIHGRVEVAIRSRPNEKIILKPNEKLVVAADMPVVTTTASVEHAVAPMVSISHLTYEKKDSTVVETAWVYNTLLFNDESFEEVARKMERWYGVTIEFRDKAVAQLRFSGVFKEEAITEALEAFSITTDKSFHYTIEGKHIVIDR